MRATALIALMLAVFVVSLGYGIVVPLLPYLIERSLGAGASAQQVARTTGVLSALYALALFLFAPGWGRLSDRYGRRAVLLIGLVGFGATMLFFSSLEERALVYAERFLSGLFASAVTPVASAVVTDLAPTAERRARRLAVVSTAGITGVLLGPTVGVYVTRVANLLSRGALASHSFAAPLVATGVLALLAAGMVALTIGGAHPHGAEPPARAPLAGSRRIVLRLLALAFIVSAAIGSFHVGLALRGKQELALTPYQVAAMFTECSVVMLVAQAIVFSPVLKPDVTRWLILPALAALAAGLLLVPRSSDYASMLTVVGAVGTSAGVVSPILTYWVSANAGAARGAELGRQAAASSLGQTVGSAAGGFLFSVSASPSLAFVATSGLVVLGVMLSVRLPRRLACDQPRDLTVVSRS